MNNDIAISVRNVSKKYKLYPHPKDRLKEMFHPFSKKYHNDFWSLRNVSFDVCRGETIGIIGENGSGKSTLLQIICKVLTLTEGVVSTSGRISAILELGAGFNPEFSGRENVYMNGALMGFNRTEMDERFTSIEEFAEIGDFINQPMKTYSSGMYVRLAFAAAVNVDPDILVIDEALAVGDTYFVHKCFRKLNEFRDEGKTILFVSHDSSAIQVLCNRAILLERGTIIKESNPQEVMDLYNAIISKKESTTIEVKQLENGKVQTTSGTGEARVEEIALYNTNGEIVETVNVGEQVELRIKVKVYQAVETLVLGYGIKDRIGQMMYGTNTWHTEQVIKNTHAGDEYEFVIAFQVNLGMGSYSILTALVDRDTHLTANYEWNDMALLFNVINMDKTIFVGCLWNEPRITIGKCIQ